MPRAAPGFNARGALGRNLLAKYYGSVNAMDRPGAGVLGYSLAVVHSHPVLRHSDSAVSLPLHILGSWVVCGCLGEVESLVGDCRPPPPGNPRRPSSMALWHMLEDRFHQNLLEGNRFVAFFPGRQKIGGAFLPLIRHCSFNCFYNRPNLKKLNKSQYFKNYCSFFSCADKHTMLRFAHSHCHLYGFRLVGSPSMAITFVLEM